MAPEEKEKIINVLVKKAPNMSCPICQGKTFTVADGYSQEQLQEDYRSRVGTGERIIPSFCIICTNCGFISHHALGAVGLIKEEKIPSISS